MNVTMEQARGPTAANPLGAGVKVTIEVTPEDFTVLPAPLLAMLDGTTTCSEMLSALTVIAMHLQRLREEYETVFERRASRHVDHGPPRLLHFAEASMRPGGPRE